jgi:hypothetical protein
MGVCEPGMDLYLFSFRGDLTKIEKAIDRCDVGSPVRIAKQMRSPSMRWMLYLIASDSL